MPGIELSMKVTDWQELSARLKQVKNEEAKLRREICEELFEGAAGEFSIKRRVGYLDVKATSKVNRKVDEAELDSVWELLREAEKACFKFKPTLQLAKYKALKKADLVVHLYDAITESPGMPTLEVKEDGS